MPTFGGLSPFPLRFGGGKPLLEHIVDSLNAARGTAYDTSQTSTVYAENLAIARALEAAWSANARLRNQMDPDKMSDFLPRWLKILGLPITANASTASNRALVKATFERATRAPTYQAIYDLCSTILGDLFVDLVKTTSSTSGVVSYVPASESWDPGYWSEDTITGLNWYSLISHLVVLVEKPTAMDDSEFYATIGRVIGPLDSYLPSWVTFDLVRDGVNGAGFYLDEDDNLDNQRFD